MAIRYDEASDANKGKNKDEGNECGYRGYPIGLPREVIERLRRSRTTNTF